VKFVLDKVALGQVFSEYFGFPCQSSFHWLLHNHHPSSGAGTIGQQWPTYQVDSVSPHPEKLKKKRNTSGIHKPAINLNVTGIFFRKVSYARCDVSWFVG
jgi:hypothetical protein